MHHRSHRVFFEIHAMYVFGFCEEKSMTLETLHYYFSILNQNPTNPTDFHLSAKIVYVTIMIFGKCLIGLLGLLKV